jgi:hypothetical protein
MDSLTRELLDWVASRPRTYAETMEAWRTSCPRHSAWEDALIEGLIAVERDGTTNQSVVTLTLRGLSMLSRLHANAR